MTFLNPTWLLLLGLAPVIVLLYLRRERRRLVTPALFLWPEDLSGARPERRGARRLTAPVSLLLQLAALVCAALAAARPAAAPTEEGRRTVIVADGSARMRAAEAGEAARRTREALAAYPGAGVVVMDAVAEAAAWPGGMGPDERLWRRLEAPSFGAADGKAALALARDMAAAAGAGGRWRLVWISDRPPPEERGLLPEEAVFERVRTEGDNVAVTAFGAAPSENASGEYSGFVAVRNFSGRVWEGVLRVDYGGRPHEARELRVGPGGGWQGSFRGRLPEPGAAAASCVLEARLEAAGGEGFRDALPEDDRAFAVAEPVRRRKVLLGRGGDPFFERAVRADPLGEMTEFDATAGVPVAGNGELVALTELGVLGLEEARRLAAERGVGLLASGLPGGAGSEGAAARPGGGEERKGAAGRRVAGIRAAGAGHPVLRGADFGTARVWLRGDEQGRVAEFLRVWEAAGWRARVLAEAEGAPVVAAAEREEERGRAVFLFLDPDGSDLPLRVSYPVLVANAVRWVAARGSMEREERRFFAGEPLPLRAGEAVLGLDGREAGNPPPEPGVYRAAGEPGKERLVAVNVNARVISDLRGGSGGAEEGGAGMPGGERRAGAAGGARAEWMWAALAAGFVILLAAEWELYRRRVIG